MKQAMQCQTTRQNCPLQQAARQKWVKKVKRWDHLNLLSSSHKIAQDPLGSELLLGEEVAAATNAAEPPATAGSKKEIQKVKQWDYLNLLLFLATKSHKTRSAVSFCQLKKSLQPPTQQSHPLQQATRKK